jgi:hypothetical protein
VKASSRTKAVLAVAAAALVVLGALTLGRWSPKAPLDDLDAARANEAPVPEPTGLLAEVFIGSPNASWGRLQRGVGGAAGILPASAGGIVCAVAGLDPLLASEIDGRAPAFGAIAGDPANPTYAFALKLNDLRKARGLLVDGDTARFASRDAFGVTELLPKAGGSGPALAVGISPNGYLVLARRAEDFAALVPYATRTLPARALPADGAVVLDVPRSALGAVVRPKLDELWGLAKAFLLASDERMRNERGGRAPDYGDPRAIVAALDGWIGKRIAIVGDLERLRVAVDVADDGVAIVATMTPVGGEGPAAVWSAAMLTGDTAAVGAMPATSAVALATRDSEQDRAEQALGAEKTITSALGPRLGEGDAKKLHDVLDAWTRARSDTLAASLAWDEPQGLALRAPVRDEEAASRAVRGALDLARVSPFKELLRTREVTTSTETLPGLGKVSLVTITREPRGREGRDARRRPAGLADAGASDAGAATATGKRAGRDELALAWAVEGGALGVATGELPLRTLGGAARPERKLGDEPSVARALGALGVTANSVVVLQPLRFDPTRASLPPAPLVIALGKKGKEPYVRMDIAHGVLRELARWQMGL